MTEREYRLRRRIDMLTDERNGLRRLLLLGQVDRRLMHHCAYCGRPCWGRVCIAHRDLVALDPFYSPGSFA